jgi:hypothetical protein
LKKTPGWFCVKYRTRRQPLFYHPATFKRVKSPRIENGGTFQDAYAAYRADKCDGVWFPVHLLADDFPGPILSAGGRVFRTGVL